MCWTRCGLLALCAVFICQTRISEARGQEILRGESGDFSTCHFRGTKSFSFLNESPAKQLFIEVDLSKMQPGEMFKIDDDRQESKYQSYTYMKIRGGLKLLDKSYNAKSRSWQAVSTNFFYFETSHGKVQLMGKFRGSRNNCGGISGTYHRYSRDELNRCRKAELPPVADGSSLNCEDDFGGNATRCTGDFTCPPHHTSLGEGVCQSSSWKLVCAPDPTAWEEFNNICTKEESGTTSRLETCSLDTTYMQAMVTADTCEIDTDDEDHEGCAGSGRSPTVKKMKKICSRFCTQTHCRGHYPDVTDKISLNRYITCNKCVYNWRCNFGTQRFSMF